MGAAELWTVQTLRPETMTPMSVLIHGKPEAPTVRGRCLGPWTWVLRHLLILERPKQFNIPLKREEANQDHESSF